MLSQLKQLSIAADGRYANDTELMFLQTYLQTARLRFSAYQKIQAAESQIVQQVQSKLLAIAPELLRQGGTDLTAKWKRDTLRVLRYAALALLTDDAATFRDRMLIWFQTIMRSFHAERSCNATYVLMQDMVQQYLTAEEFALFAPILEMARSVLGEQK